MFFDHHTSFGQDVGSGRLPVSVPWGSRTGLTCWSRMLRARYGQGAGGRKAPRGRRRREGDNIVALVSPSERLAAGGKLLMLGNGGSATDATDWALDCVDSPKRSADSRAVPCRRHGDDDRCCQRRRAGSHVRTSADRPFTACRRRHCHHDEWKLREHRRGVERGAPPRIADCGSHGYDGGDIVRRGLADHAIVVRSDYIPRIQEIHASIYHVMTDLLAADDASGPDDADDSQGL